MASSTYMTFLMHKAASGSTWTKLFDIKDFPDLFGDPDLLETTTMSDRSQTFTFGVEQVDTMAFTGNYDFTQFKTLKALEGTEHEFAVWFGGTEGADGNLTPTGDNGKFSWKGHIKMRVAGKGVNEVKDMIATFSLSAPIVMAQE